MAKKHAWQSGDVFGVPMPNAKYGLGQIISLEKECMDSVVCAFFENVMSEPGEKIGLYAPEIISIQFVTKDSLARGIWRYFWTELPLVEDFVHELESVRGSEYVGVKIRGSGIMQNFLSAYHGLSYWDEYADKQLFDKLLLPSRLRPVCVIFKDS